MNTAHSKPPGKLVTQPSAGRLFGGDNDRAAAGVSAQSLRGPLPWPALGKTKLSVAMAPISRNQEVKMGPGPQSMARRGR